MARRTRRPPQLSHQSNRLIEHIPFSETRNYVMRIMETVTVYRMRLSGNADPIRITEDLERG